MLYAALGFALVALAFAWRLLRLRRQTSAVNNVLETRTEELRRAQIEVKDTIDRARRAETNANDAEHELVTLTEQLAATKDELNNASEDNADLNQELDASDQLAADQSAELASMAIEAEDLNSRLSKAEAELAVANNRAGGAGDGGVDSATLWKLELARSERTWRYSVALLPDEPSPFSDADDVLALAVETEAAALRDEVGAFLSVEWRASAVDDPARAHLVLRLAQEVLAKAARLEEPTRLVAEDTSPDQGLTLRLEATEDGDTIRLDLQDLRDESLGSAGVVRCDANDALAITVLRS